MDLELTRGRFFQRGLTWKSAVLSLVLIVGGMFVLGAFIRQSQPEYPMTATVLESRVVGQEPECSWEVEVEFLNDSDRPLRLYWIEIAGVEGSRKSLLGSFDPAESIARTYQHPAADCAAPGERELSVTYGPTLSRQQRTVTFPVG